MLKTLLCVLLLLLASACDKPLIMRDLAASSGVTVVPVATFARPNQTADGSVSYLVQRAVVLPTQVASGLERLQLEVVVTNQGTQPLTVDTGSFRLTDKDGAIYEALEPETRKLPQLIGAEIVPTSTLVGVLRFDIPMGVDPADLTLLWCLQPDCKAPLSAPAALPGG